MKLKTLKLHNFKGIENFTLENQGKDKDMAWRPKGLRKMF